MVEVTLRDGLLSEEAARRCSVNEFDVVLLKRKLRWFGHAKRRDCKETLGRNWELDVDGKWSRDRPKKSWWKKI